MMSRMMRSAGLAIAAVIAGLVGAGLLSAAAVRLVAAEIGLTWGLATVAGFWLAICGILALAARSPGGPRGTASDHGAADCPPAIPVGSLLTAAAAGIAAARGRTDEAADLLDRLNRRSR